MDLLDEIRALPAELLAGRDTAAIAGALSEGRTQLVPKEIGSGTIIETIGLAAGNALLDVLYAQADFRHVKPMLEQGRLRVDSALVRATLDSLAGAGVITAAQCAALKALAEAPSPVSEYAVRRAVWSDDGQWLA